MIRLHRLGHSAEPFDLNPDMILTVEAAPDTHIALATGTKLTVIESPDDVTALIKAWRREILSNLLKTS